MVCQRLFAKLIQQRMDSLPVERLLPGDGAFEYTGIDIFAPIVVIVTRSSVKRWGCLFTCLKSRSSHIEKLDDMSADSFIQAMTRFSNRQTKPVKCRSDQGSNIVAGQKELNESIKEWREKILTDPKVLSYLDNNEIEWELNPPYASNMGGVWERVIRSARRIMNTMLKDEYLRLDDQKLTTIFSQIESILNQRPLTPNQSTPDDLRPITPNDLLKAGHRYRSPPGPPGVFTSEDVYNRRWWSVQALADNFWKRWSRDYLNSLEIRQKWLQESRDLQVNDIVLMSDEKSHRNYWPLARVLQVFPGRDGRVRSVEIRTATGVYRRPANKLVHLEGVAGQ